MSGENTDTRPVEANPSGPDEVTNVPTSAGSGPLQEITAGASYGTGLPLERDPDRSSERFALGNNLQAGYGDTNVANLQRYMAQELDPNWDGNAYGNTAELPRFGIDGAWGCETQGAFNRLLAKKGIDPCSESGDSECGPGVPMCVLDEETLNKLKEQDAEAQEEKKEDSGDEGEKKEDKSVFPVFDDQCFLINRIKEVIEKSEPQIPPATFHELPQVPQTDRTKIKYKNIHKIFTKDPGTIMNRLRLTKGCTEFLNIRHFQLSQLTPTVRLYKQYYEGPNKKPREVEMEFSTYVDPVKDLQAMLESQLQRGIGVGISSFDFTLQGVQPATAKKDIEAKMVIYAQNFNELFRPRQGIDQNGETLKGGYRFIDLLLLEPKYRFIQDPDTNQKIREFNPNFYEIKVNAGWAATGGGGLLSEDLSSAIKDNQMEMFLVVTDHNFDFSADGSVSLTINFRARLESLLLDKRSDVLFDEETVRKRTERRNKINELALAKSKLNEEKVKCEDDTIKKLQDIYEKNAEKEREESYLSLLRQLMLEGCIYTAKLDAVSTGLLTTKVKSEERPRLDTSEAAVPFEVVNYLCSDGDDLLNSDLLAPGERKINFFFLGDLIALSVNNVIDKAQNLSSDLRKINYGNIRFVLGPAPFDDPNPSSDNVLAGLNIADIPISVELFADFMREKVIKGRRNTYPLLIFLRDSIRSLMFEALGPECGSGDNRRALLLDTAQISADSTASGGDPMAEKIGQDIGLDLDKYGNNLPIPVEDSGGLFGRKNKKVKGRTEFVFDSFNKKSLDDSFEYFVIYAFGRDPVKLSFEEGDGGYSSRYERDLSSGIFHATTGLDRGLVRSMKFNKTDQKFLRELRYEQSDFKPELQLSNVYNCTVDMYGNNLFFPGAQLFVNPRGLGSDLLGDPGKKNSNANLMGLGGYHVVKQVKHSIGLEGYRTTLDCLFTTSGDGLGSIMTQKERVGDTTIMECADLQKEAEKLANEMGGSLSGKQVTKGE